jgi:3'(2'), 5'-bisphosphate nucleotidase
LVEGLVVVGVMGCPNLPVDITKPDGEKGVLFIAVKGQGAFQVRSISLLPLLSLTLLSLQRSLTSPTLTPIHMSNTPLALSSFCESVEAGHSDHGTNARIASLLGITKPSVRMDSQAKYCSIARGDGDVYLRLPVSATYEEKIWVRPPTSPTHPLLTHNIGQDHSSGSLLVEEAGGRVSDMFGAPLDFSLGRTLSGNKGVVAAAKDVHAEVIKAVTQAVKENEEKK